jgi:hypothetical protein
MAEPLLMAHPVLKVIGIIIAVLVIIGIVMAIPSIVRYIRISRM